MKNRFSKAILFFLLAITVPLPVLSRATEMQAMGIRHKKKPQGATAKATSQFACLPETFSLNEIVSYRGMRNGKEEDITIKDKLMELKAQCKDGKLVDSHKREIKFFRPACYGNPPADYLEIQQREREELEKLQKRYTVIIIECNPRIQ